MQASVPAELYPGVSPLPPFAEQVLQRHTLDLMISVTQLFLHSNSFAQALREVSMPRRPTFLRMRQLIHLDRISTVNRPSEPFCAARDRVGAELQGHAWGVQGASCRRLPLPFRQAGLTFTLLAIQAYIRSVQSCLAVRPKVILSQWYAYHSLPASGNEPDRDVRNPQVLPLPRH